MGLTLAPGMTVALDTAPLIYFIEKRAEYFDRLVSFFSRAVESRIRLVTSMVTYIEVLTLPERLGRHDLAAQYRMFLSNSEQLSIYPLDIQVADQAVQYRARLGLKTPDAIQLATARVCRADVFLTNDRSLQACGDVPVLLVSEL